MSTEKMNTENTTVTPAKKVYGAPAKENTPATAAAAPATHNTHAAPAPPAAPATHVHAETKKVDAAPDVKVETKTNTKTNKTTVKISPKKEENKTSSNKPAKKKGKKDVWVKKEKMKKSDDVNALKDDLLGKWKPVFWGRFGKKNLRTRKNPKYDKWRKPRGEDMQQRRDDGAVVAAGYRTSKAIRFTHPSGYREVLIQSARDFNGMKPHQAARFSGTIGRKKKIALIKIANEKKIQVLN